MITFTEGNLLEADADALVNTVNTVGVMGKGVALMFKEAFPENFNAKPTPFGVSFTGMACSEPTLLRLAYAFEQATKRRVPPPAIP